jgi:hypothetical protein
MNRSSASATTAWRKSGGPCSGEEVGSGCRAQSRHLPGIPMARAQGGPFACRVAQASRRLTIPPPSIVHSPHRRPGSALASDGSRRSGSVRRRVMSSSIDAMPGHPRSTRPAAAWHGGGSGGAIEVSADPSRPRSAAENLRTMLRGQSAQAVPT